MEFSVAEMFGSDDVIAHADIPGLRLFAVQKNKSSAAVDDLIKFHKNNSSSNKSTDPLPYLAKNSRTPGNSMAANGSASPSGFKNEAKLATTPASLLPSRAHAR